MGGWGGLVLELVFFYIYRYCLLFMDWLLGWSWVCWLFVCCWFVGVVLLFLFDFVLLRVVGCLLIWWFCLGFVFGVDFWF